MEELEDQQERYIAGPRTTLKEKKGLAPLRVGAQMREMEQVDHIGLRCTTCSVTERNRHPHGRNKMSSYCLGF